MDYETPIYISTSHNDSNLKHTMQWFIDQPGIKWLVEPKEMVPSLKITRKGTFLYFHKDNALFFHPSMALLRLLNILSGSQDRFLGATSIGKGDKLLDATLGLGTDALIGSWAVGTTGKVVSVEHSPILCALMTHGLMELSQGILPKVSNPLKQRAWRELAEAASRIQVVWNDHFSFLTKQAPASFDVVYFDPMFRDTKEHSSCIKPLHECSDRNPLQQDTITEAKRVATRRVVLKERKNSSEFARLGFSILPGGKYSSVDYGVVLLKRDDLNII